MKPCSLVGAVAVLIAALAGSARAQVIISNYPSANDLSGSTISTPDGRNSKAAGFTMPAGLPYDLVSVTLRLVEANPTFTMNLDLFADGGSGPVGAPIDSFLIPAIPNGISDVTFLPQSPFTLQPSTTYWLAAKVTSTNSDDLDWSASFPSITPTGIATSAGYRFNSSGTYPPNSPSSFQNTYLVTATPASVPECSTLTVAGLGVAGLLGLLRRRRVRTGS